MNCLGHHSALRYDLPDLPTDDFELWIIWATELIQLEMISRNHKVGGVIKTPRGSGDHKFLKAKGKNGQLAPESYNLLTLARPGS